MWSRMWGRSRQNAVWFINQDVEPQLYALSQIIGTAGVQVYLPANGISGQPYGTLFGRPVIPVEYAATLGTEGDITLCDFSQYVLADKGGVQSASSMHVDTRFTVLAPSAKGAATARQAAPSGAKTMDATPTAHTAATLTATVSTTALMPATA